MTRFGWVMATCGAVLVIGATALLHPAPWLIWNASASVPIGLYAVHPARMLRTDELLVVMPPEPLATFLDERRYLPKGIPLLKHVAALPGHTVCRTGDTISIDGSIFGAALDRDHLGRSLPVWRGCRVIAGGEVFLMNRQSVASLDSRYFGPLPTTAIVGRAEPIWTEGAK
jgi:conjugative transfer signal peptidase TraF